MGAAAAPPGARQAALGRAPDEADALEGHGDPERRKMRIVKIISDIHIQGDVSEREARALLEAAAACPLHQTQLHPPELIERVHIRRTTGETVLVQG